MSPRLRQACAFLLFAAGSPPAGAAPLIVGPTLPESENPPFACSLRWELSSKDGDGKDRVVWEGPSVCTAVSVGAGAFLSSAHCSEGMEKFLNENQSRIDAEWEKLQTKEREYSEYHYAIVCPDGSRFPVSSQGAHPLHGKLPRLAPNLDSKDLTIFTADLGDRTLLASDKVRLPSGVGEVPELLAKKPECRAAGWGYASREDMLSKKERTRLATAKVELTRENYDETLQVLSYRGAEGWVVAPGDSGGALYCKDPSSGEWLLVGVNFGFLYDEKTNGDLKKPEEVTNHAVALVGENWSWVKDRLSRKTPDGSSGGLRENSPSVSTSERKGLAQDPGKSPSPSADPKRSRGR